MMRDIIIGRKRNNVIEKLKKSRLAKLLLIGAWVYIYEIFGKGKTMHLERLLLIGILGIGIVNLLYIPQRLIWSEKISSDMRLTFVLTMTFSFCHYMGKCRKFSLYSIYGMVMMVIITSLVIVTIWVAVKRMLRVHSQNRRVCFKKRDFDSMEGHEFEYFCADLLEKNGFSKVKVTQGSGDYGIDLLAEKNGETYAIQCKRYEGSVGWHAVEEAHAGATFYNCRHAVVLTNSTFTKQAVAGAARIGVELWNRPVLESMM